MKSRWFLPVLLALVLAGCSLAEDVTPPPGLQATQAAQPTSPPAQPISLVPPAPPNPSSGEAIYAERCAPCHGDLGRGDGPQASQLPNEPTHLGDPAVAREAVPADWYQVVTQGRLDQMMPPFASLTDAQRWDVVAYSLGLDLAPGDLDRAKQDYADSCASCHGDDGGTPTAGVTLSDPSWMAGQSQESMVSAISQGSGQMPAFSDSLSESQLWALSAYVRQLAYSAESEAPPVASSSDNAESPSSTSTAAIAVSVSLASGSEGDQPPADIDITLHGFDGQQEAVTQTATLGPGGKADFPDLDVVSGRLFVASAEYKGVLYVSDVSHLTGAGQTVELPLTLYDTTTDASAVRASQVHVVLQFPSADTIQVTEIWVLSNTGDKTVVPTGSSGLLFSLPPGASNIGFDDTSLTQQATRTSDGFSLAMPLRPGTESEQLVFFFDLPYQNGADFRQTVHYPVGGVTVLLPDGGPTVKGASIADQGVQSIGSQTYHLFGLASFQAGDAIELQVVGRTTPLLSSIGNWPTLVLGVAALVLVLAAAIAWYRPSVFGLGSGGDVDDVEDEPDDQMTADALLERIAELDDAYDAGEVDETAYRRRRADLKRRALDAMRDEDD
jgi:mono/diheme cytochrome c family protein